MGCKKGIPHRKWSKSEKLKLVKLHLEEHMSIREIERQYSVEHSLVSRWLENYLTEELFLDFDLAHAKDVPALLDTYVDFFNNRRPAAALGYKSPVQYKTELGFG